MMMSGGDKGAVPYLFSHGENFGSTNQMVLHDPAVYCISQMMTDGTARSLCRPQQQHPIHGMPVTPTFNYAYIGIALSDSS